MPQARTPGCPDPIVRTDRREATQTQGVLQCVVVRAHHLALPTLEAGETVDDDEAHTSIAGHGHCELYFKAIEQLQQLPGLEQHLEDAQFHLLLENVANLTWKACEGGLIGALAATIICNGVGAATDYMAATIERNTEAKMLTANSAMESLNPLTTLWHYIEDWISKEPSLTARMEPRSWFKYVMHIVEVLYIFLHCTRALAPHSHSQEQHTKDYTVGALKLVQAKAEACLVQQRARFKHTVQCVQSVMAFRAQSHEMRRSVAAVQALGFFNDKVHSALVAIIQEHDNGVIIRPLCLHGHA